MIPILILMVAAGRPAAVIEKPDTNFKSIHQVQSEEHKPDTLKPDSTAARVNPDSRTMGYATYFLVLILLVVILVVIVVLLRSRYKIKRE